MMTNSVAVLVLAMTYSTFADPPNAPQFGSPILIAGDEQLISLDSGDLDGDGLLDVVGTNTAGQVSVYRNTGGVLAHDVYLPLNAIPFVLEARIARLNADNLADIIAIGGGAMNHQLYFQQADRSFSIVDSGIPGEFYFPNFDVDDMDGDRDIDFVTINPFAVHLNDGAGNFTTQGVPEETPIFDAAALGNINNDGQMDFLRILAVPGTVQSMTNSGGALTMAASHPLDHDFQYAFADFNSDGLTDVASLRFDQPAGATVLVLTSSGDGSFSSPIASSFADPPHSIFPGDINADGVDDLIGHRAGAGSILLMLGVGDGSFINGGSYDNVPTQDDPFVEQIFDLLVADIDGDGDNDILLAAWKNGLVVIPNDTPIDQPADVNGDGAVNVFDLLELLGAWGICGQCPQDINNSGAVDVFDLLLLLGAWS